MNIALRRTLVFNRLLIAGLLIGLGLLLGFTVTWWVAWIPMLVAVPEKEYEGSALLQLGSIAYKKGNTKEAMQHLRAAVEKGLPDEDSKATAFLQLSSLCLNARNFRGAKFYYGRAKTTKPKNEQVLEQMKEMAKYMARIPG
jgi:tetratricopeptide (TPR) repeat protein